LLANLANLSGVPDSDPVLLWLKELRFERQRRIADGVGLEEPKTYAMQQAYWPRNLKLATGETVGKEFLMRVWSLGVRRYCRRECGIPVPEIILRTATLSASSADLDVVLLLQLGGYPNPSRWFGSRPGWLPWFGRSFASITHRARRGYVYEGSTANGREFQAQTYTFALAGLLRLAESRRVLDDSPSTISAPIVLRT